MCYIYMDKMGYVLRVYNRRCSRLEVYLHVGCLLSGRIHECQDSEASATVRCHKSQPAGRNHHLQGHLYLGQWLYK